MFDPHWRPLLEKIGMAAICLLALFWRLDGLDWDEFRHFHPDERYISWVATSIEFTGHDSWADVFSPRRSSWNPYYWPAAETTRGIVVPFDRPRNFAYGHFPLYAAVAFTRLIEALPDGLRAALEGGWRPFAAVFNARGALEFDHLTAVGRALAALTDTGTVYLIYRLGRRLFSAAVGLLASLFLAATVMHIQLAHFFIFDTFATFFVVLTLLALVRYAGSSPHRLPWLILAGAAAGLAVGSKFSAILLAFPLLVGVFWPGRAGLWRRLLVTGVAAFLAFALTNPFALLDTGCPLPGVTIGGRTMTVSSCFWENIGRESQMVRGDAAFPFTRQYDGTRPFLYPIEMQLRWGMGWPLGLAAFLAFAAFSAKELAPLIRRSRPRAAIFLLLWGIPFFISTGSFAVKFMRYFQPLTPFLVLFAAWGLERLRPRWLGRLLAGGVAAATLLYAASFTGLYRSPHPWVSASEWIYAHAAPGQTIAVELWDEPLPASLERPEGNLSRKAYELIELDWLSDTGGEDDAAKLAANLNRLAAADYLVVASNRSYGVTTRLPEAYPLSGQFYPLFFAGRLGFAPVWIGDRNPRLAGWQLVADTFGPAGLEPPPAVTAFFAGRPQLLAGRADESFTVYDHPLVMIWKNEERLSGAEMMAAFHIP